MKDLFENDQIWKNNSNSIVNILYNHNDGNNKQISILIRIDTEEYFEFKSFYLIATYFHHGHDYKQLFCVFAKDLEEVKRKFENKTPINDFHCVTQLGMISRNEVLDINKTLSSCLNFNMSGERLKPFLTSFDKSKIKGVNNVPLENKE